MSHEQQAESDGERSRFKDFGKGKPPSQDTIKSTELVNNRGNALELGPAPGLRDARFLAPLFTHLDLVDTEPTVADALIGLPEALRNKITFHNVSFDDFLFAPNSYDYICAVNSLPFSGSDFDVVFQKMITSLRPGGVFSGTIWTPAHAWNLPEKAGHLAFRTEAQIKDLLSDCTINSMELDEGLRPAGGEPSVFWSAYKIIATKNLSIQPE